MPKRVPEHITGDKGVAALQNFFTNLGWTFESVEKDYGLDAKVEVFEGNLARAYVFFIQSKGTSAETSKSRQIAQYFDEEEVNYFTSLNTPILIVRYSTVDKILFAKWAYSDFSFEKTPTRYKIVFSTYDTLVEANSDSFKESVNLLENITQLLDEETIGIQFLGDIADTLRYTRFCNKWFNSFGIPLSVVEDSPIRFKITKKNISLHIFGIINETKSNNLSNMLHMIEIITKGIGERANYQVKFLRLIHDKTPTTKEIVNIANNFRDDVDYLSMLDKVEEDDQGFLEIFRPLISVLQLRYFSLNMEGKKKIRDFVKNKYTLRGNPNDFLNYLLILQSENDKTEMPQLLEELKPSDDLFILNGRLAIEYANFAHRSDDNEEALRVLSLCSSDDEDVIYLKARLLIQLGRYSDSMLEFRKINQSRKKSTDFLILYTMAALLVNEFGIGQQTRIRDDALANSIINGEQAVAYITDFDALEPNAWLILSKKPSYDLPRLNEPEFYAAFSGLFSKSPQHFALSIELFIKKIYYSDSSDVETLRIVLVNLIEEALTIFGKSFLDDVLEMLIRSGHPNDVINNISQVMRKIEYAHIKLNKSAISDKGSGFIGNTIYRPSIMGEDW